MTDMRRRDRWRNVIEKGWRGTPSQLIEAAIAAADAEQAELRAVLARVEALVEQWEGATEANEDGHPVHARVMTHNIAELRAAITVAAPTPPADADEDRRARGPYGTWDPRTS